MMAFLFLFLFRKLSSFPLLFSSAYLSASSNFRFSAVKEREIKFYTEAQNISTEQPLLTSPFLVQA